VITPRLTRLLRVPDLQAMHRAVAGTCGRNPAAARGCAVLVPTRGAAIELRRTLENLLLSEDRPVVVLPDILTRANSTIASRRRRASRTRSAR